MYEYFKYYLKYVRQRIRVQNLVIMVRTIHQTSYIWLFSIFNLDKIMPRAHL